MATNSDKTTVIQGDSNTLKIEREKAQDQEACLIIIRGSPQGKRFELTKNSMFLGRDPQVELVLNDTNVSRKHAEIIKEGNAIKIRDNQSTNGTFINDKPVVGTVALQKEDMLKLGNTILKFLPRGELEIFYLGSLENAAYVDQLTKTYNKAYLLERFESEIKRAKALHEDFSLIIFDLDFFKKINDTYGHDAGDYVLTHTCQVISQSVLPKEAIFGRYGGEEFLVLLPTKSLDIAAELAEKMRLSVEKEAFVYDGKKLTVTASFGVAELSTEMDSHQVLFKAADKALYESKAKGRNLVTKA